MSRWWNSLSSAVRAAALLGDAAPLSEAQRRSWLRHLGVLVIAAKCVILPLVLDPRATHAFALPKASASRALLYVLLATLVAYLIVHRGRALRWSPVHSAVLLLGGVYLLATVTAMHLPTALFGAPGRYLGLVTLLDNVVFALGVSIFVRTSRDLLLVGASAFGAAVFTLAYGLVQALGKDPIPWESGVFFSSFGNSGPFAGYVLTVGAAAAGIIVWGSSRLGWVWRASLLAFAIACFTGVVFRGARASTLALVPVVAILVVLGLRRHAPGLLGIRPWLTASGALLVVLVALAALVVTPAGGRLLATIAGGDSSSAERAVIYRAGLRIALDRPLLGAGPDNFVAAYPGAREPVPQAVAVLAETSAHSWVFKTATDAGLLGLGALVLLIAIVLVRGWKGVEWDGHEGAVAGSVIVVAFLAQGALSLNDISTEWLFWLGVGLVAGAPLSASPGHAASDPPRRKHGRRSGGRGRVRSEAPLAIVAIAAGLLASTTLLNAVAASQFAKVSLAALAKADGATAVRAAEEATRRDGGRGEPWNALGAAYSLVGRTEQAVGAFRRAVDAEPYTRIYLTNLADEELKLVAMGQRQYADAAIEHARAAATLAPSDHVAQYGYARILNILGGHEREAAEYADRAARLAPDNPAYVDLSVTTFERAGDLGRAIARQREAVNLANGSVISRIRLARLLVAAGDRDQARSLIAPPQVKGVDRGCAPLHGAAVSSDGKTTQPRCFRVLFTSEDLLQSDPTRLDSVSHLDNFALDGRPLDGGTTVAYDPAQGAVVVQIPAVVAPPGANASLTLRRIANTLGFALQPDPTTIRLP